MKIKIKTRNKISNNNNHNNYNNNNNNHHNNKFNKTNKRILIFKNIIQRNFKHKVYKYLKI